MKTPLARHGRKVPPLRSGITALACSSEVEVQKMPRLGKLFGSSGER